jgi:hypothetical protein
MMVKDGNGAMIDFEWPSLWYLFKAGAVVTMGVFTTLLVLWIPLMMLWAGVIAGLMGGFRR